MRTFPLLIALVFMPVAAFAEGRVLRLGVSAPLTGDLAEYGAAVRNGIDLARTEKDPSLANVDFVFEDNRYDAAEAVSVYRKLRDIDHVDAIFNWGEPTLGAIAPLAAKNRFPVLAMSLDAAPAENNDFVQLINNPADEYASAMMRYLRSKGTKRIGILQTEDPFLESMVAGLRNNAINGESIEVFARFAPGDNGFKTQIARLKSASFDAIGVYLFSGQVSAFFRQAESQELKGPFFGTDFFESRTEISQAGPAILGAVYPNVRVPKTFLDQYVKRYGNDAQIAYAYNAYVFAKTTARLFSGPENAFDAKDIVARYRRASAESPEIFTSATTRGGALFYRFPLTIRKVEQEKFVDVG